MSIYKFVNVTRNIDDVAGNTNILNIGIISLFESVVDANEWSTQDAIMAFPEKKSNPVLRYQNGDIELNTKDDFENADTEDDDIEEENCTYCGDILKDHIYGNICEKHVPSYALWDNEDKLSNLKKMNLATGVSVNSFTKALNDYNYDREAFYEELSERRLAIELDEYDCGQDYDGYDDGYGYEDECEAESFY